MKRYAPLIAAMLLSAVFAFSQTTYLGNILQLHRQVEPLPAAASYQGAVLYNYDAGTVYFSNGTSWAALGSGTASLWADAGAGGIYNSPASQVRVGNVDPDALLLAASEVDAGQPFRLASLYVYSDGGYTAALYKHEREYVNSINQLNPLHSSYRGANLTISTNYDAGGSSGAAYTQILLAGGGNNVNQFSTITEANPVLGSYVAGLNLTSSANIGLTSNSQTSNAMGVGFPSLYITTHQVAVGQVNINANSRLTVNGTSMTNGIYVTSTPTAGMVFAADGPDMDLGTGSYDYLDSNGTRVQQGSLNGGGLDVNNLRIGGNSGASNTVTSTTTGNGGIGFNQASGTHYMMATGKEYRPILSGADWVHDGRTFEVEVTHELTACPVARKTASRLGSGGGDVTVFCSDSASATVSVGAGHPAQPYRNFVTTAVGGERSIFGGFTTSAPASGASATPQTFVSRQAGPVVTFRLRTGSANWASNVTWYAGLFSSIPTSGSPLGSSVYLRFDTNNPAPDSTADTKFRLCACNSGTCSCSNLSVAPATSTEYLFEIDCRESSTACYAYMNGAYETSVSSNLPGTSTPMGFAFAIENVDGNARTAGLGRARIRQE